MYHYDSFPIALFIYAREVKALRHVEVELNSCHLPFSSYCILTHEVKFGAIECRFAHTVECHHLALFGNLAQEVLGTFPLFWFAQIFIWLLGVSRGQAHSHFKPEGSVEFLNNVPDLNELLFCLAHAAEDVGIVLGEGAHSR